jgi:hypothetical protein
MTANNPSGVLTPRVTATNAALAAVNSAFSDDDTKLGQRKARKQAKNVYRDALPKSVGKIAVTVEGKFGEGSPEFAECFPHGRKVFSNCADDELANNLQTLINGVTNHQSVLGAQAVTDATALLTGWNAVYASSESSTGAKTTTQQSKAAARTALQKELFTNLLTIALNNPRQPQQLDAWMQSSLLSNHTPPPPEPAAPVLTRDAGGQWSLTYMGAAQVYWQIWSRCSENPEWSNLGEIRTDHFPAGDDAMSPGGTWWQVKICGEDGDGNENTPFSNVISFGNVPA